MRTLVDILVLLAAFTTGSCAFARADSSALIEQPSTPIYLPITLPNLVRGSQRIFVGRVRAVRPLPSAQERQIEADIEESFRWEKNSAAPKSVRLRMPATGGQSLSANDRVLWFLPRENADGLSIPLGRTSGDFRVDAKEAATSLNGNRGLWPDDTSLWESSDCSRNRFLGVLSNRHTVGPTLLNYLRLADNPYRPQPLPLRFLTAAVVSCLPTKDRSDAEPEMPSDASLLGW